MSRSPLGAGLPDGCDVPAGRKCASCLPARSYIARIAERDFHEMGRRVRDAGALRRWMAAYAAATSTSASYEVIRDAAAPGDGEKSNRATLAAYRRALEQLWIIDDVPAWTPSHGHFTRLGDAPPAPPGPRAGDEALFESLAVPSVRVYAQALGARVGHLRTHSGSHGIDIVVERDDGRVIALEVKLAQRHRGRASRAPRPLRATLDPSRSGSGAPDR